jgi:hypothetical protein
MISLFPEIQNLLQGLVPKQQVGPDGGIGRRTSFRY